MSDEWGGLERGSEEANCQKGRSSTIESSVIVVSNTQGVRRGRAQVGSSTSGKHGGEVKTGVIVVLRYLGAVI